MTSPVTITYLPATAAPINNIPAAHIPEQWARASPYTRYTGGMSSEHPLSDWACKGVFPPLPQPQRWEEVAVVPLAGGTLGSKDEALAFYGRLAAAARAETAGKAALVSLKYSLAQHKRQVARAVRQRSAMLLPTRPRRSFGTIGRPYSDVAVKRYTDDCMGGYSRTVLDHRKAAAMVHDILKSLASPEPPRAGVITHLLYGVRECVDTGALTPRNRTRAIERITARVAEAAEEADVTLYKCPCCGILAQELEDVMLSNEGEEPWCDVCISREATFSEVMNGYIRLNHATPVYGSLSDWHRRMADDYVLETYARHSAALYIAADGVIFSDADACADYTEQVLHEDTDADELPEYHSSRGQVGHIPSEYDKRTPRVLLGLELEFECDEDDSLGKVYQRVMPKMEYAAGRRQPRFAWFEQDGSLEHGMEMVTGYTGLDVFSAALPDDFTDIYSGFSSHDTETCGLHVHIDKAGVTLLHAAKMNIFVNSDATNKLVTAVARRAGSSYASKVGGTDLKYGRDRALRSWKDAYSHTAGGRRLQLALGEMGHNSINGSRYSRLNFANEKTIEFRLYKGTTRKRTIMACLEFTFMVWHFTRQAGLADLTETKFMEFIYSAAWRKDCKNLREYLNDKGYGVPLSCLRPAPAVAAVPVVESEDDIVDDIGFPATDFSLAA